MSTTETRPHGGFANDTTEAQPSVSVVIATRGRPEMLQAAIDAVVAQDYDGVVECLVVFDQCDPRPELEWQGPGRRVRVITNAFTPGLAGARNSGVTASAGELLAFCDDDDTWFSNKLRCQVEEMRAADAGVAVSGIVIRYGSRSITRTPEAADLSLQGLKASRVAAAHPSTVVATRAAFDRVGPVDEKIPGGYGEDYDWLLRAVQVERIAVVTQPLVTVHWGRHSYFSNRWRMIIDWTDYCLAKHAVLRDDPKARGQLLARKALALAADGDRGAALRCARVAIRLDPRAKKAWLAIPISLHLLRVEWLMRAANSRGRGL